MSTRVTILNDSILTGLALVTITVLAMVLRLYLLGQDSFWGDELASVRRAQLDGDSFWGFISDIPAMTVYYVVLHFWVLLGDSEIIVRTLSVITAVVTIPIVYLLGKHLFNSETGLIAALLLAVNALHVQYSQEARSYSMLILMVSLSYLFFAKGIERSSRYNWIGYTVASVLAVYSHPFALLVLVSQASSLVFLPMRNVPGNALYLSGISIGIALLPILLPAGNAFVSSGRAADASALAWIPDTSFHTLHGLVLDLTGKGGNLLLIAYVVALLSATIAAVKTWISTRKSIESWKYGLALMGLFLPISVTVLYSYVSQPALVSRYLLICLPPLALVAAVGIWNIYDAVQIDGGRTKRVALLLATGVLVSTLSILSAEGVSAYHSDSIKEDWRGAAAMIMSQWQPGDGLLFYVPNTELMLQHYIERSGLKRPDMRSLVPNGYPNENPFSSSWARFLNQNPDRMALSEYLPDSPSRVWLVLARNQNPPSRSYLTTELRAALGSKYQDLQSWHSEGGLVKVHLYRDPIPGVFEGQMEENMAGVERTQVICRKLPVTIVGTSGNDQINGMVGADVIHGLDGTDIIDGLSGNDVICGGTGNDVLSGGVGDDTVDGGDDDDTLKGGPGADKLFGLEGNNQLFGEDGEDILVGGPGNDKLNGGTHDDVLNGEDGDDTLHGDEGNDVLNSGLGDNSLDGGSGRDKCRGRGSNKVFECE
jgi:hypothetical protein